MKLFAVTLSFLLVANAQQGQYSLSSLDTTQVTGLSSACSSVYTNKIDNCNPADFIPTNPCSAECITTLQSIETEAQAACVGANIPAASVLTYFASGNGVQQLCTKLKAAASPTPTTFMMSVMPMSTASGSTTSSSPASTATAAGAQSTATVKGGDTSMALPKAVVIAIVIVVIVVISILAVVGIVLFRKYYK
jgi:hypothetical protein